MSSTLPTRDIDMATRYLEPVSASSWKWDRVRKDAAWRTDGTILVRREACDEDRLWQVPYDWAGDLPGGYTVDPESCEDLWAREVEDDRHVPLVCLGIVDARDLDLDADVTHIAALEPRDNVGRRIYVNAHRLSLLCWWTGAREALGRGPSEGVVLRKEEDPVAIVMPLKTSVHLHEYVDDAVHATLAEQESRA